MLKILLINPHKTLDLCGSGVYYMRCHSGIAQSVEHLTVNQGVTGSSPVAGARISAVSADFFIKIFCGNLFRHIKFLNIKK